MAQDFDPYHRWLGIPPTEQPANHYRLLAISQFESDPEVIRDAAAQRMAHVRTYQLGPNSALSQAILNELGAAKAVAVAHARGCWRGDRLAGAAGSGCVGFALIRKG